MSISGTALMVNTTLLLSIGVLVFVLYGIVRKQFASRYYAMLKQHFPIVTRLVSVRVFSWIYVGSVVLSLLAITGLYVLYVLGTLLGWWPCVQISIGPG